jgi:membrane-associated phospholipid phosphatase
MGAASSTEPRAHRVKLWLRKLLTFWALIVAVSAVSLLAFADLGEDVAERSTSTLDNGVQAWFAAHQNPTIYKVAFFLTWAGSPMVMVAVAVAAGILFYRRRGRGKAGVVVAAPAAGGLVSGVVKLIFGRARPAGGVLLNERTYSFPSGHAATSAAVVVTLCYVLAREGLISWPAAIIIGGGVPLVVGLTRLYLNVHWATDVLAGWTVGLFVAAVSAALYEHLRRTAPAASEDGDAPA